MAREEVRAKRPFKIWDCWRNIRKGVVVGTFEELIARGRDKLGVPAAESVRLVLEADGTHVEDGDYFRTLPTNSVLLLLRTGERWLPAGVDVVRAALSAIPKIVCETIHALELHDETPSWKIMDNKGRVTVVLHWDQRRPGVGPGAEATVVSGGGGKFGSPSRKPPPGRFVAGPQITVINHDDVAASGGGMYGRLPRQAGSFESAPIHVHTPECATHAHRPRAGSPSANGGGVECDFHCCALHEEGRPIAVHKSVATSPIQDAQQSPAGPPKGAKGHVRFLDVRPLERDSSESETENTVMEDEAVTSEKFLLLVDQLSVDQKRHLTIKDIGIILERLSSKILDVERLDRESESDDCFNWTIKATIRGEAMRELGVIYNGNYYAISEHPGYKEENEPNADDDDDEEEEDRL